VKLGKYFGNDYEIIWDMASNYLPENKLQTDAINKLKNKKSPTKKEELSNLIFTR
jgi:uncharacterized protein with HEPN domain